MGEFHAMLETPQPHPAWPKKDWYERSVYGAWCVVGVLGLVITFSKHGLSARLGFLCYTTVFGLAMYFLLKTGGQEQVRSTRAISTRCLILFAVANVPLWVHVFFM